MEPDFSKIFHESSKNLSKGHPPIPENPEEWPDEWRTTYYKAYPRMPKIDLSFEAFPPKADQPLAGAKEDLPKESLSADFFDLIKNRQSRRNFTDAPVTRKELSVILKYSCGITGKLNPERSRRAYPSGGACFPIEIYPVVFRDGNELKSGLYHYNVKENQLDYLWERGFTGENIDDLFVYPWVKSAALAVVMTAVFSRSQNKYGERGYRYILLEAGHIGQNIYLTSEALGFKCCALGGTKDEALEKLIDIDGITESVVYALAIGK